VQPIFHRGAKVKVDNRGFRVRGHTGLLRQVADNRAVGPRLLPLLPAHVLHLLPVLLALSPILIAPYGPAYHGNPNQNRDNGDDNEIDTGCYSDTQGKTSFAR
jgi:hypothetical protein